MVLTWPKFWRRRATSTGMPSAKAKQEATCWALKCSNPQAIPRFPLKRLQKAPQGEQEAVPREGTGGSSRASGLGDNKSCSIFSPLSSISHLWRWRMTCGQGETPAQGPQGGENPDVALWVQPKNVVQYEHEIFPALCGIYKGKKECPIPFKAGYMWIPWTQELLLFPSSPISGLYLTITCAIESETYSVHFIKQIQVKMNTFIFTEMMIFSLWDYWIALLIILTLLGPVITFPEIFPLTSMEIELPSWFWRFCVLWLQLFLKWIKAFFVYRENGILNVILFFLILFFY